MSIQYWYYSNLIGPSIILIWPALSRHMLTLGPIKLSCIKCINGHRTSYCDHINEFELYELKPKGRPRKNSLIERNRYEMHGHVLFCFQEPKQCCNLEINATPKPNTCTNCTSCTSRGCCQSGSQCNNCTGRCGCGCGQTDQECNNCATDLCPKYWIDEIVN